MIATVVFAARVPVSAGDPRFWEAVTIEGPALDLLLGVPDSRLSAWRCRAGRCEAVPIQLDERDAAGRWVLDHGPAAGVDEQPGVVDSTDAILVMASDAGDMASTEAMPAGAERIVEVRLDDPLGFPPRRLYLVVSKRPPAPRDGSGYVSYDPGNDRLRGSAVEMGFTSGMPRFLAVPPGGTNLLDRLKIRATVRFLFGLLRFSRGEGDLDPGPVSWRAGPIRVLRRQNYTISIGFGIRSPGFTSETFFYRDYAEMPVTVRLRVPPRFVFTDITVRAVLDFRDLSREWAVIGLGQMHTLPDDCSVPAATSPLDGVSGDWFALRGRSALLVERLVRGPTLGSVRQRLRYRAGSQEIEPPEEQAGQCPGIGFTLENWDGVEGGRHVLSSVSYALPPDADLDVFLATVAAPLRVAARLAGSER